ncbi:MAG: hypothetical protein LBL84_03490 [Candidatus Nomurabacteria bacterium]|jgi:hypothetical protein|nr:hypothetical protein [Candidatus Nomurabacteria bacterium]
MTPTGGITGFDFTPLSADVKIEDFSPEEIKAQGFDYPKPDLYKKLKVAAAVTVALFLAAFVLTVIGASAGSRISILPAVSFAYMLPLFCIVGLVFYIIVWSRFPSKVQLRWMLFAKRNGLTYHNPKAIDSNLENLNTASRINALRSFVRGFGIDGVFFKRGVNSFDSFVDLNDRTTCFEHCKTVSHGKNSTSYYFNVVRYDLGRPVPNILLDGQKNINPMEGERYDAQAMHLEGDFNKHFKVFAPEGYHIDTLQILSPDVMADLVDHAAKYDIELVDHYVYIAAMREFDQTNYGAFVQDFFVRASEVIKELGEQVDAYTDRHDPAGLNQRLKLKT